MKICELTAFQNLDRYYEWTCSIRASVNIYITVYISLYIGVIIQSIQDAMSSSRLKSNQNPDPRGRDNSYNAFHHDILYPSHEIHRHHRITEATPAALDHIGIYRFLPPKNFCFHVFGLSPSISKLLSPVTVVLVPIPFSRSVPSFFSALPSLPLLSWSALAFASCTSLIFVLTVGFFMADLGGGEVEGDSSATRLTPRSLRLKVVWVSRGVRAVLMERAERRSFSRSSHWRFLAK